MIKAVAILFLLQIPAYCIAQLTNTGYDELINDQLENLEIDGQFTSRELSQKPLSIWKIYQLLDSANDDSAQAKALKRNVNFSAPTGWKINWIENISTNLTFQNTPFRPIAINGLSEAVEGVNQPLFFPNADRRFQNSYWNVEFGHRLTNNKNFELYIRPQVSWAIDQEEESNLRLKNAWVRYQLGMVQLQIGRDEIRWHDSNSAADLYGNSGPTFDMIRISTPTGFRLPWFLKNIGNFKYSTYLAHLGQYKGSAKSILSAWRIDYQFKKRWNATIEHTVQLGGGSNPWPNVKDFIAEYIGFAVKAGDLFPSDHKVAYSLSYMARDLKIYGFVNIEDTDRRIELHLWRNALWKFGFVRYNLGEIQNKFLRVEIAKSGPRVFKHHIYNNHTLTQPELLNFTIGPDAFSLSAELGIWMNQKTDLLKTQLQFYYRSSDVWERITDSTGFKDIDLLENNPEEFHYILKTKYFKQLRHNLNFVGRVGLDIVQNSNFDVGNTDFNYLVSGELIYRPFLQK